MKRKAILCFLAIMSCFVLCSCKSKAVIDADSLISSIGEVTLDSGEAIQAAESAVEALSEKDYEHLEHLDELKSARVLYDDLVDRDEAEQLMASINRVKDNITLDSKDAIAAVRIEYNKASTNVRNYVTNYSDLEVAEETVNTLLVEDVIQKIDAIGTVTLKSEDAISAAQNAFNNLGSILDQDRVSNIDTLRQARETLKTLKEKEAARKIAEKEAAQKAALKKMRTKTDKVEGITWYHASNEPRYANSRSYVLPYIGKRGSGSPWLRLKIHYTGDDWIFWTDLTFFIDGVQKYSKSYDYFDVLREVGGGDVWECIDISPSSEDIKMLEAIADSKETIIRFKGKNHRYDLTVKASDKTAINDVLTAYESLKGT